MLWLGQVISQSGDSIYQIGLLWLVLELSGSETVTGFAAMASYLPSMFLALFAGALADRGSKRKVMLTADLLRFAIVLFLPFAAFFQWLSPTVLTINAFALACAAVFFYPARDALLPKIVPTNQLMRANTMIQTSWQFSLLLGPAVAAILLQWFGKVHLFTVDALFYLGSFACILAMKVPHEETRKLPSDFGMSDIISALKFALKHPILLPLLLLTITDNLFIMGPANVGTPVFVKKELLRGAGAYASTEVAYAIGMITGTLVMLWIGKRVPKGKLLLMGMFLDGLTFIPMLWVHSLLALQITFVVHSMAIPFLMVPRASLIQEITPRELTGRVFAMIAIAVVGMTALSSALTGIALSFYSARIVFFTIGIGGALCAVVGWIFAKSLREAV